MWDAMEASVKGCVHAGYGVTFDEDYIAKAKNLGHTLERSLTAARQELEAMRRDGERYRWLRQWAGRPGELLDAHPDLPDPETPEHMDAAMRKP